MRRLYLVAYDIRSPKRWRRVERLLRGYGKRVQLSVFQCDLPPVDRQRLAADLDRLILHGADSVLIVDLGPSPARKPVWQALGVPVAPHYRAPTIV